jgi:hypothetical protein
VQFGNRRAHARATRNEFGAALHCYAVVLVATSKSRVPAGRIFEEESGVTIYIEKRRAEKPLPKIKTMEEFSAASGISRATVSKYFNDPDSVRPATYAAIEFSARALRQTA